MNSVQYSSSSSQPLLRVNWDFVVSGHKVGDRGCKKWLFQDCLSVQVEWDAQGLSRFSTSLRGAFGCNRSCNKVGGRRPKTARSNFAEEHKLSGLLRCCQKPGNS